ncbi:MAG TPA: DUF2269 family protein [Candidatus Dormibacteraeota bacterium]|nr:DUF2269 family protein [Candidatus Dormibacteraeota bacterium]
MIFWLLLHVAGAIFAFGPTLVFPIVGGLAARDPKYGHFAAEVNHTIEARLVIPVAASMAVSGIGLIIAGHYKLTRAPWLGAGIILYVIAMGIATGFLAPTGRKLVEATAGGPPAGGPPPGAPAGPPPHIAALIKRTQVGGVILLAFLVVIIFLMVVKPGG